MILKTVGLCERIGTLLATRAGARIKRATRRHLALLRQESRLSVGLLVSIDPTGAIAMPPRFHAPKALHRPDPAPLGDCLVSLVHG